MPDKKKETHTYITREIPGLACLFLALTTLLALVSHNPGDPSLSSYSTAGGGGQVQNYIGPAGAYFSALFIDLLGLTSFWLTLVLGIAAWRFFRGRAFNHPWLVLIGVFLLLLDSAAAFSMIFPRLKTFWLHTPGGGILGDYLAASLVRVFAPAGAGLIVAAAGLIALIMATGLSIIRGASSVIRAIVSAKVRLNLAKTKRREKAQRAHRLREALDGQKNRADPKIKEKPLSQPVKPPKPKQEKFEFMIPEGPYSLPPFELLDELEKGRGGMSRESLMANARLVESKLSDFNVSGEVVEVSTGPVITMYEYQPAPGIKISKVAGLADDLAMNMRAVSIRIVAPLPGKPVIGIEIPNPKREIVSLKEVMSSAVFQDSESVLTLIMGVDIMGRPEVTDLRKMPHLLIAGATGSGKSVGLNAMIMSILFKARPDEVRFLMIDPKRIELAPYNNLPHLIYPVISNPKEATQALKWAVADMEDRYRLLAEKGARNIEAYNRKVRRELEKTPPPLPGLESGPGAEDTPAPPQPLPYHIIIIDELADLMVVSAREVEESITRLAQMARAAGIHLILATQRPSVDVLTGVIKANMPTRVSFQVASKIDSRTILDTIGSEKLLGNGDMLFLPPGAGKIQRIHGAYVSEAEIKRITDYIKAQQHPDYIENLAVVSAEGETEEDSSEYDEKYNEAVELVARTGKASISLVQRHLRVGYNRAARIIEIMEREGVVGPADGAKPRQVLVRDFDF
ncbi:MAG: DNA translocase FtsK 4TM domain-containing protein [Thermodesulfobacteriota bacterium]|nr:DNA translocase FtsK 4TM domain-containing protein [Thermodesulfobacteriota bacterium]